jgi:osmoprotectant transport system substrate-binding protein
VTTTKDTTTVTTTRRRLAAALLVPVLAFGVAACTDSDDDGETSTDTGASGDTGSDTGDTSTDSGTDTGSGAEFTFRPLDAGGPNTKAALENGDIDIALLFSSDGAIVANDWVALEDDENLQPADNFVPAIRTEVNTDEIAAVLDAVSATLTVEAMQEAVAAVSIDGENPEDVAGAYLEENDLPGDLTAEGSINVGSANFAESTIAAQLYGQALEAAGVDVSYTAEIGARDVYYPALESGEIDLVPEFTGTLLGFLDGEATPSPDVTEVLDALRPLAEEDGITILEPAEADSVNTFVVTQETADEYGLASVSDLAGVSESLVLGGPPECPERPYCLIGLQETYGLTFAE